MIFKNEHLKVVLMSKKYKSDVKFMQLSTNKFYI
jgi:hypothetical protein